MDTTYILIGALFLIFVIGALNYSKDKEQIKRMQAQINELCRVMGHDELVSTYISDKDKELLMHLKNTGKEIEAIKKIRDITDLDLKEAKKYFDSI
ncbi:50S ribosomal protein L7/L12 [Peptostreptococcus russellii]|uniref:50S ribosomal protein L7/L12 n=1 Tax=Peptostreptococcus russellii TaxID=215200 RepID=UPI00162621D8|nr:50S ribosomal protein L7/L12 [Peptostreptococcus russellii]MBC2577901.1 50S ribosomal protein L7/L12 [Peptostreptococcus russellii]